MTACVLAIIHLSYLRHVEEKPIITPLCLSPRLQYSRQAYKSARRCRPHLYEAEDYDKRQRGSACRPRPLFYPEGHCGHSDKRKPGRQRTAMPATVVTIVALMSSPDWRSSYYPATAYGAEASKEHDFTSTIVASPVVVVVMMMMIIMIITTGTAIQPVVPWGSPPQYK